MKIRRSFEFYNLMTSIYDPWEVCDGIYDWYYDDIY